ncbi:SCF E3 ubiquitin ligase complex F-box protein pof2-like [Trifolium pratense]|uniref:SCF E3 ubiquitin ligase complex F-box protein pof2-like n=1 Tax=Trifolium pratense TaxID=57577 RepID=UPI001E692091|nr:SCF E3 ubiquitin ligase complex F-box protein pof2-like [Trifolium pratense]
MKRKRKRTSSARNSSSSSQQTVTSYYLPDECWESIFRFIIYEDDENRHYLNSLSLVSKRFLSITNSVLFSFTIGFHTDLNCLFKRFTNLNSLKLDSCDFDQFLIKISCIPMKLTSLYISYYSTIPANVLRAFSQKITTLTSLTCYPKFPNHSLDASGLFLIAECFPLLQELDLSYQYGWKNYSSYVDVVEALSLALIKLRKVNFSGFHINNQSLFHLFNNCKHLEEVILFNCDEITNEGFVFALRERPTLTSLSFSLSYKSAEYRKVFSTSHFINSLVNLKGLTCLVLQSLIITDELLYSIAREVLPLTRLDLQHCTNYSYNGILCLLSNCQGIKYLDLQGAYFLEDEHVVKLSSLLRDLEFINLSWCAKLTKSALFTLTKNCPSLSEIKMESIGSKSVHNSDSFVEFGVRPQLKSLYLGLNSWLSNESIIMFASVFPNLQLLDLWSFKPLNDISEGICEVLRKCSKIRHLKLNGCSRVNLLGLNFVVPNLEVLNLSGTMVNNETLYVISKSCCGLLQLLLYNCKPVTQKGVKYLLENCTKLRKIRVRKIHVSTENKKFFSRHGCHIHYCD